MLFPISLHENRARSYKKDASFFLLLLSSPSLFIPNKPCETPSEVILIRTMH
ncbi:hypothetical protein JCM19047_4020 [Bacillus sp. JCM 19047]|nr:hypothetical protein JCM19047_4020 [Bacillus sp. JCM 19047]